MERNITLIKNNHEKLETRCKSLLNLLRVQLDLWKDFTRRLNEVNESVEEVNFMTDLMCLHGTVDYQRLATVTDNLQVSGYIVFATHNSRVRKCIRYILHGQNLFTLLNVIAFLVRFLENLTTFVHLDFNPSQTS